MELELRPRHLPLRRPLATSYGTLAERELLEVRVVDGALTGVGEAAPLEPYDGVALAAAREAVEACRPLLAEAGGGADREELLDACWLEAGLPQAVAAIDLALWDLEGKRAGVPVADLLGAPPGAGVPVNALIAAEDRAGAADEAAAARAAGFGCVKVKVGTGDDAGRLAAVRAAAGPEMAIRVDANGAWTVEEAVAALERLAPVGLELAEEPVHGVEALAAVRARAGVEVAMDETAADPGAVASGAADAVCLKLARWGGISGVLAAAAAARAADADVYLASSLDGPAGVAGALHAAGALGVRRPCGLATLGAFAGLHDPFPARGGTIAVPRGPGLGLPG